MYPVHIILTVWLCVVFFRQRTFENVRMSSEVGRDKNGRVYYVTFGSPPLGIHGGNTAASSFAVARILRKAMSNKKNHRDGGWKYALKVSACIY